MTPLKIRGNRFDKSNAFLPEHNRTISYKVKNGAKLLRFDFAENDFILLFRK